MVDLSTYGWVLGRDQPIPGWVPGKNRHTLHRILMMLHDWHFVNKWILWFCGKKEGNVLWNSHRDWQGQASHRLENLFAPHDPESSNISCPWIWTFVAQFSCLQTRRRLSCWPQRGWGAEDGLFHKGWFSVQLIILYCWKGPRIRLQMRMPWHCA